jgi:HK97 family phage major capsid protein
MPMTNLERREKMKGIVEQSRAILKAAETEKRELTTEERTNFNKAATDLDTLKTEERADLQLETSKRTVESFGESTGRKTETRVVTDETGEKVEYRTFDMGEGCLGQKRELKIRQSKVHVQYREFFDQAVRLGGDGRFLLQSAPQELRDYVAGGMEFRSLQKDLDIAGGVLSAPEEFQAELIMLKKNLVWMRQIAKVLPPVTSAETLGIPTLDAWPSDPLWTSELNIGLEDTTATGLAFGKRALKPWPLAKFIKVSKTLLRRSAIPVEGIIQEALAYKQAVAEENNFLNGTGAGQPLGIFTIDSNGIGSGQNFSSGNTTTAVTYNGILGCKMSLPKQYRTAATGWVFNRTLVTAIMLLKDGIGHPIWGQPGGYFLPLEAGEPDQLLGHPVYESEYAPNTMTTGLAVGMFGDFKYYQIVDALTMTLQTLVELYAGQNQNGYIARSETDGMPVLQQAFARLCLA